MRPMLVLTALLILSLPAFAQPATAPAAKPPDLSGEATVVEQMSTVDRVAADGSSTRTFQMKARVLSDAGLRGAGTVIYGYASSHETVTFDYVRVRKPDGSVVETPTGDAQEVPYPVTQAAPMYSDVESKQLPVKSLSVGDTLEYQVTAKSKNLDAPGAFWGEQTFYDAGPVREETIEIRVPRAMVLTVKSKTVQPVITEEGGERVYRWKHANLSEYPKKKEKDAAPVALVQPMYQPDIAVTTYRSWAEFGAWYQGLMKDRAVPDAAIQAKADELTKGLTTDDAKIDALYHYVATQFRYISVSLGLGRVQPHAAAEVFRNQYGDCKDKHTLLEAMLAAEKIDAEPVLIHSSVKLNEALPMPSQFDHMITLVKPGAHEIWLDSTPEVAPSRVLLANLRGKQALAIPLHGDAQIVTTPATLPFPSFYHQVVTGKLDEAGTLTAHFDATARGDAEVILRAVFHQVPAAKWAELQQNISYQLGFSGEVSAVEAGPPEKTADPFHVSWDYTRKEFGDWPNRKIPGLSPNLASSVSAETKPPERAILLDSDAVAESKVTLTLPKGYTLTPPEDVKRSTAFAEYTSTYLLKGSTLEMDRRLTYKMRELPVSEWAALREFLKAVSDDAGQMMQLTGPPGTPVAEDQKAAELIAEAEKKIEAKDTAGAEKLLDEAQRHSKSVRDLMLVRGNLQWLKQDMAAAIADYRKELQQYPDSDYAYSALAGAYRATNEPQKAQETWEAWAKQAPSDERPKTQLARSLMAQEKFPQALAAYQEAIALSAKPESLKSELGIAQLKAGQTDAGKATLHALLDGSEDPGTLNNLAYQMADMDIDLSADEGAARKAVDLLERRSSATEVATASQADLANVALLGATWDTLGWIYYKEHKLPEAESYVWSAWMLSPNAEVGMHMGRIYEAEGKKEEALKAYRLGAKSLTYPHLAPQYTRMKQQMEGRVEALKADGVREKSGAATQPGGDELGAMRTYHMPSPLKGEYASADFLLLMRDNHAEAVRFVKGSESLRVAESAISKAEYSAPLPKGSHASILRQGILACTTGSKDCLLVLVPPSQAKLDE